MTKELKEIVHLVVEYERVCKRALGFTAVVAYRGIRFNVSSRLVAADLSPLAYLSLVEDINGTDSESAVVRLYDRLFPLLSCIHEWSIECGGDNPTLLRLANEGRTRGSHLHVCLACTAYTMSGVDRALPTIGRSFDMPTPLSRP